MFRRGDWSNTVEPDLEELILLGRVCNSKRKTKDIILHTSFYVFKVFLILFSLIAK